jgi:hypothetical protein
MLHPLWDEAWDAASDTLYKLGRFSIWNDAVFRQSPNYIVRDACQALITYDDAGKYLDLSSEKLKMIIALSEHPAAILLLPAVVEFEKEVDNKPKS